MSAPPGERWRFDAIGAPWSIHTPQSLPPAARASIGARVERFDADWSRFRDGSVVDGLRDHAGAHRMPDDAPALLDLYARLFSATDGAMSPAIGEPLEHLGYDAGYTLRPAQGHRAAPDWSTVRWEPPFLHTRVPFVLDVGAAGKGYLADLVAAEVLAAQRFSGLLGGVTVDASGDLAHHPAPGAAPLRVALEHPERAGRAVGVVELDGAPGRRALCASATNRRTWADGRVHHVLDARTGVPVEQVLATWVVADSALVADGLATALFFLTPDAADALAAELGATYVRFERAASPGAPQGRRLFCSPDLPGDLFT